MIWYAFGNLSKDQAKQIVDQAVQLTGLAPMPKDEMPAIRIVDLSS